jgi:hypothetical protein
MFSRKNKVSKEGVAVFDGMARFPSVALFLDVDHALILQEKPGGVYVRVGTAEFETHNEEVDKIDVPRGTVKEVVIV